METVLQRSPAPTALDQIFHLRAPSLQEWRFEWHPATRRVYVINVSLDQPIGEPIAEWIPDAKSARVAVAIWVHGYQAGNRALLSTRSLLHG